MELSSTLATKCTSIPSMYKRDNRMYVTAVAVAVRALNVSLKSPVLLCHTTGYM
jgi:hypothetical protein